MTRNTKYLINIIIIAGIYNLGRVAIRIIDVRAHTVNGVYVPPGEGCTTDADCAAKFGGDGKP